MPRPTYVEIDTPAVLHNLQKLQGLSPHSRLWAVVKANAYGHGLLTVASALQGVYGFAVAELDSAVRLRDAGYQHPILLLEGPFHPQDMEMIDHLSLTPVIHADDQLEWLCDYPWTQPIEIYLKFNSGMNRLGFTEKNYVSAWQLLHPYYWVKKLHLMSHLANADLPNGVHIPLERVRNLSTILRIDHPELTVPISLANSAALLQHPNTRYQSVRPGIALYGISPFSEDDGRQWGLRPVMSLKSAIIAVQQLGKGDTIGYGSIFSANEEMRIGIVACGYGDGYPRHARADNRYGAPALVDGVRTRIVGRVAMDMMYVDITHIPEAGIGSPVTLWGDKLSVEEVADACQTIAYELVTRISARPKRIIIPLEETPVL